MEWFANLFEPSGLNHTAMFAKLYCAVFAVQLLFSFKEQYLYFLTRPEKIYGAPPQILGLFGPPAPGRLLFLAAGCMLLISLCAVVAGFFPRVFVLIAFVSYFFYFMPIMSLAYIQRKTNLLPFVLLVLLVSPFINDPINKQSTAWELTIVKIAIAQLYFSAGLQKVRHSGFTWFNGKALQAYLLENYLWSDQKLALQLASKPKLCMIAGILVLVFELTFWIVIPLPALTPIYIAGGLLFHTGTLITMRINYLRYILPVYMVFFTNIAFKLLTGEGIW